jgi:hypothetical protein
MVELQNVKEMFVPVPVMEGSCFLHSSYFDDVQN